MRRQKRIRGRQDLQLDEQSLQILVETIPTLMWRAAPDGQIDYVNKRLLEYFGSPLEEIIGWGWMEKAHPNDVAFKAKTWLSNLETTTSHDVNCRFQGADGAYRWFNVRGEPLRDRDGSVRSWYGVFIDIDNQKQAEEKSRESELKLRQITETIPGLVWSTDPDGEPTHFNQRLLDYSGMRLEDFQHRGWETFLHPADFSETEKAFYHAIQTGTSYEAVHRLRRSDGEYRWHHVRGEPLHDREGRIVQWYGLSVDIDERKRAEEELRNSEAKIRRLVDSNIIGIFIWDFDGRVLEANDEFLRVVNYDREDLVSGRVRWTSLTPPDWREQDKAKIEQHKISGRLEPFEKEYMRKDGSRVPVLIGVATFEESANEGVAFVLDLTEHKRAEEKSRESELKLRQIVETLPGLVWSNAPDGEPSHINQRMLDYSGMPFEEFRHRGWEAFVHPADYPETAEAFGRAIQNGTSYQGVMRLRRADGEFRWHDARCEPLRDREGRIVQWYGLCVDIGERKKVEDQLRRSEAYLAEAERLSHTGGWAVNRTGERTIVYWSEECYRIFGFDPLQGLPTRDRVWQQVHPDDRSRLREAADAALGQKRDYVAAFRILLPEGTIKYLESNAHHLFSADGELLRVVGTFVDVTERKRADDALRESERNLRSVIDGIAGLVAVLAPNGELESVNRQLLEYFGRSLEWAKDWGTNDMVHPEDRPRAVESFAKAIACGLPYHTDQRLRGADGEYRWFETRGVPIRDDSGRIERWYVLLTDIEDRTRALARLEQMQGDFAHINRVSMMGELAASLSHEITQPIGSARNNARAAMNFLERFPPDISEVREALGCVVGDTDRAGEIIDRIRDHIKKAPPRKRHFDLNEAINEVIVLGRSAIIKNGVSVQTRLSEGLFPIHCDRVQLQQVVLNLILNAAEAMGSVVAEPRELMISTEQHHTGVLVAVRDSGPGIDPTHLERVFEAFYTTKSRGVGMGLSICRSIIDAHGGRLWAEPNEPRGTIFQFTLPAVQVRP